MAQENDEFSYSYLRNMWAQKEKVASPLQMHKPKNSPTYSFKKSPKSLEPIKTPHKTGDAMSNSNDSHDLTHKSRLVVVDDDDRAKIVAPSSPLTTSQITHSSSVDQSCSFQDDITGNLMKLNQNGFVKDTVDDSNDEIQNLSQDETIRPTRLWDDNEEDCSSEVNVFWDKNHRYSNVLENRVWNANKVTKDYPEKRVTQQLTGSKTKSGKLEDFEHSSSPKESRDSYSTTIISRDFYDYFDPYDNFEAFTVNSEETVKMQNKEAFESTVERKELPTFPTFDTPCYEEESVIPDSAFENMAARIACNITGSGNMYTSKKVGLQNNNSQNTKVESMTFGFGVNENNSDKETDQRFNVPFLPQRGMSSAESDVFDGLSDIGSMMNAFGFLTPDHDKTRRLQKKQGNATTFPNVTPSSVRYPMEKSTGFPNRILEKSPDAKRRLVENLASFAKKHTTKKKPIKETKPLEGGPNQGEQISQFTFIATSSSLPPVKEDVNDDTFVQNTASAVDASDQSLDPSAWNEDNQVSPYQHDSLRNNSVRSDVLRHREEDIVHHSDNVYRKEATDLLVNVTWIPSMIRLYKLQFATTIDKKPVQSVEFTQSPSSVVNINMTDNNISYSDLILQGFSSILLHRYEIFGGRITDPMSLLRNYPFDVNGNIHCTTKLENHTNSVIGNKRFSLRKKRFKMLDKAVEVHLNGMSRIQMKRFEGAVGIYESFFESYSRREFEADDVKQEKQLISAFLFNMGIIYAHIDEINSSLDFLNESLATLVGHEDCSDDIARILNEMGIMKFATKNFEHALKDFADSLEIYQGAGNNQGIARTLNNIGATYFAKGDIQSALDMFDEALEVQRSDLIENFAKRSSRNNDKNLFKGALKGVSETLCNMGYLHKAKRSSSTFFIEEALGIHGAISDNEIHDVMTEELNFILSHLDSGGDLCEL